MYLEQLNSFILNKLKPKRYFMLDDNFKTKLIQNIHEEFNIDFKEAEKHFNNFLNHDKNLFYKTSFNKENNKILTNIINKIHEKRVVQCDSCFLDKLTDFVNTKTEDKTKLSLDYKLIYILALSDIYSDYANSKHNCKKGVKDEILL